MGKNENNSCDYLPKILYGESCSTRLVKMCVNWFQEIHKYKKKKINISFKFTKD